MNRMMRPRVESTYERYRRVLQIIAAGNADDPVAFATWALNLPSAAQPDQGQDHTGKVKRYRTKLQRLCGLNRQIRERKSAQGS